MFDGFKDIPEPFQSHFQNNYSDEAAEKSRIEAQHQKNRRNMDMIFVLMVLLLLYK